MQAVVALHRESHRWIRSIPEHWDVVVYSKCNHFPRSIRKTKQLPNIGRESHTYLHHICENYDNLHDLTVFLQGWPFDHAPYLMKLMNQKQIPNDSGYFRIGTKQVDDFDLLSMKMDNILNHVNRRHFEMLKETSDSIPLIWKAFHQCPLPKTVFMNIGHQFGVSSDLIRSFPLKSYQKVLKMHHDTEFLPWAMEKIFPTILKTKNCGCK